MNSLSLHVYRVQVQGIGLVVWFITFSFEVSFFMRHTTHEYVFMYVSCSNQVKRCMRYEFLEKQGPLASPRIFEKLFEIRVENKDFVHL